MARASFRFYEELNDFLPPPRRKREFAVECARAASVKNAIEACGVPHTEVELILANGVSVDFGYLVQEGDRIAVYPVFEAFDIRPLLRVRPEPLRRLRFVADAHLGGLAHGLRLLGFDTLFDGGYADEEIRRVAVADARTVLTRDRELLKCRDITHGCYVHALKPRAQLVEVVERLQLAADAKPFSLCLECNLPLASAGREAARGHVPDDVLARHERYAHCTACHRMFWEGSQWRRMRALVDDVVRAQAP